MAFISGCEVNHVEQTQDGRQRRASHDQCELCVFMCALLTSYGAGKNVNLAMISVTVSRRIILTCNFDEKMSIFGIINVLYFGMSTLLHLAGLNCEQAKTSNICYLTRILKNNFILKSKEIILAPAITVSI